MRKMQFTLENITQNKDPQIQKELSYRFSRAHLLTNRFLESTDPEGLGHLGSSIIATLGSVSKIAISNPEFKSDILKEMDKLVKHASDNIIKLKGREQTHKNWRKIELNQQLISDVFKPAIEDIRNDREYDIFRKDLLPKKEDSWNETLNKIVSSNTSDSKQKSESRNREMHM